MNNIKAVIFDFDGTIGDTLPLCLAAFRKAIEPFIGEHLSDERIVATFGPSEDGTIMKLCPEHYEQALTSYLACYEDMHGMCPAPFYGIKELLEELHRRGVILGLVTGKGRGSCDISLRRFGLDEAFDMTFTGSPHGPVKVEGITAILRRFGLNPSQALYVGDLPSDILFSREAGVEAIGAAWAPMTDRAALEAERPCAVFGSVKEFGKFLEKIVW